MKIVFISNYYTHHQAPFCEELYKRCGVNFHFIETVPMSEERKNMGWSLAEPAFVIKAYESIGKYQEAKAIVFDADVVIKGDGPYDLISERLEGGKLTFLYSERIYKNFKALLKLPYHYFKFRKQYQRFDNFYLLCASAFTSADFLKINCFSHKAYKWGYFTSVERHNDIDLFLKNMKLKHQGVSILWAARLIKLKHPEAAIEVAKRLVSDGYCFHLNIIGDGMMHKELEKMIIRNNLQPYVKLLGFMSPKKVREYMDKSDIFLFTSDKNEGWGAVLNECMNSACVPVASHAIGSVPFLINEKNGMIYKDGDINDLYNKVKWLIDYPDNRSKMAKNAYYTIVNLWNAETATSHLFELIDYIKTKNTMMIQNGPCSEAPLLKNNWLK